MQIAHPIPLSGELKMQKKLVSIVAQLGPEIKPEGQFQHSESERSHSQGTGRISQNAGRSPGGTVRSLQSGKPVPCDRCGEVRVLQGCCIGCGAERVATRKGLEAIGSILARLSFEGGEG